MKIAVLGTGVVGAAIATKLLSAGHQVMMGSRSAANENALAWASGAGAGASNGDFSAAIDFGEMVFNCTSGAHSLEALGSGGDGALDGKVVIDVANALDASSGMPPVLAVANTDSLGEQIQRAFPNARVVKTLNTVNYRVMVDPSIVPGEHHVFLSGNDAEAKSVVLGILGEFGWPAAGVIDLGDISTARGPEMYLALWLRLLIAGDYSSAFNIRVVRGEG